MSNKIILYTLIDSPPGRAVEMALTYLNVPYITKLVDFDNGEHFSEEYLKMYPQGEIPVLNDNGIIIGESVAIIQYLAEKYPKDDTFYPKNDVIARSIIHHRLSFHLSTYYRRVHDYMILPMDYAACYKRTDENLKKTNHALKVFNELLGRQNTAYVAGGNITIADLPLMMGTVTLKAMDFDFSPFPHVEKWYSLFQSNQSELWPIAEACLMGLMHYNNESPRDLTTLNHWYLATKNE